MRASGGGGESKQSSSSPPTFKVVLVGDASVGKSALVIRFTRRIFPESTEATVGAAFTPHTLALDSTHSVLLEIWDTAGQERFASLAPMYYRGAAAALVVYDQSSVKSFERAKACVRQLHEVEPGTSVIALVANKADLGVREVPVETAASYAESEGLLFFETSAKTGLRVQETFLAVGTKLLQHQQQVQEQQTQRQQRLRLAELNDDKAAAAGGCC